MPANSGWHLSLMIVGFACFVVGGFGSWAYGAYDAPDPDRVRER